MQGSFGNYRINFSRVENVTLSEVFGAKDLKPSEMTKLLWIFIKKRRLAKK